MMALRDGLRVEEVTTCLLCGREGELLYRELRDRLFGAPGTWDLLRCSSCGFVWLNPRPVIGDTGKLYPPAYSTPSAPRGSWFSSLKGRLKQAVLMAAFDYEFPLVAPYWRWVGRLAGLVRPLRDMVGMSIMYLSGAERGRLLEVGCGNGRLLAIMRDLGWEVLGVEPDPVAARAAREHYGVPVVVGTLEGTSLPEASVDVVALHHVLEHVHDPIALLKECRRVLRRSGKLVVVTPNVESLGHRVFGPAWRGLEPPRHLHLFSLRTLRACVRQSGFHLETARTVATNARRIWGASRGLDRAEACPNGGLAWAGSLQGWAFQILEGGLRLVCRGVGEEIFLAATKLDEGGRA